PAGRHLLLAPLGAGALGERSGDSPAHEECEEPARRYSTYPAWPVKAQQDSVSGAAKTPCQTDSSTWIRSVSCASRVVHGETSLPPGREPTPAKAPVPMSSREPRQRDRRDPSRSLWACRRSHPPPGGFPYHRSCTWLGRRLNP